MRFATSKTRVTVEVEGVPFTARIIPFNEVVEIRKSIKASEDDDVRILAVEIFTASITSWGDSVVDDSGSIIECTEENRRDFALCNVDFTSRVLAEITEKVNEFREKEAKN